MRERIERYARRLESLSIEELSSSTERLVSLKRRGDAELIAHLVEMSRRRGHLELGYASLFDYCQRRLGLADGEVWRRTQVAGVAGRFPRVLAALIEGKVSLTALSILAAHLSEENVDELLREAEGKTTRQVKEIVAGIAPKPVAGPGIRRKSVRSLEAAAESPVEYAAMVPPPPEEARGAGSPPRLESETRHEGRLEAARPEVWNFRFSAGKEFKEKLERLAEVLGIAGAERRMPEILERAIDLALEKKDPQKKLERRRKRESAAARRSPLPGSAGVTHASSRLPGATGSAGVPPASSPPPEEARAARGRHRECRYPSSAMRERVHERASYQCEYTGDGGVRCGARVGLEIDHAQPWGKGGGSEEENLRVLCRAHNLFCAAREFGEEFTGRWCHAP